MALLAFKSQAPSKVRCAHKGFKGEISDLWCADRVGAGSWLAEQAVKKVARILTATLM